MSIDVNVHLGQWPLRRLPCDEMPALVAKLRKHGVTQAWAGSFEALLHRDIGGVNRRLAEACYGQFGIELLPFGTVNPTLPDWQEDLRRCHEVHRMPGVRLYPNYHGYGLESPLFAELLDAAAKRGLIVQLVARIDDVRTQHPLLKVPNVDLKPLPTVLKTRPKSPIVLLNAPGAADPKLLAELAKVDCTYVDIATQEGVAGVGRLVDTFSAKRVLFGSHFPFFALESAVLKMQEAALAPQLQKQIESENAAALLHRLSSPFPVNGVLRTGNASSSHGAWHLDAIPRREQ